MNKGLDGGYRAQRLPRSSKQFHGKRIAIACDGAVADFSALE